MILVAVTKARKHALLFYQAAFNANRVIHARRQVEIMRRHQHRQLLLAYHAHQQSEHHLGSNGVEVSRRLIGEHNGRVIGQRTGDGYALLFAARKRGRTVMETVGKAELY